MKALTFFLLAASVATTIAYSIKSAGLSPLTEADWMGALIEYPEGARPIVRNHPDSSDEHRPVDRASYGTDYAPGEELISTNPTDLGSNYSSLDNIELDHAVDCYHWPSPSDEDAGIGYRKCYNKNVLCNMRWRADVRAFRTNCLKRIKQTIIQGTPICKLLWEPDIVSASYCRGLAVPVDDDDGNRVLPCGEPAAMGPGANCPAPQLHVNCTEQEDCESLEPDPATRKCKGVWSECERNFVQICPDSFMPCQSRCGDPQTCQRGFPMQAPRWYGS